MSNNKKIMKILIFSGLFLSSTFASFSDMPNKPHNDVENNHKQNYNDNQISTIDNINVLLNTDNHSPYQINKINNYQSEQTTNFDAKTLEMIDKNLAKKYANKELNKTEIIDRIKLIMDV